MNLLVKSVLYKSELEGPPAQVVECSRDHHARLPFCGFQSHIKEARGVLG